jgi:hypothetical protein
MNADEVIKNFKNAQLLLKFAFDPDQPRDENGKFASGGGGGAMPKGMKPTLGSATAPRYSHLGGPKDKSLKIVGDYVDKPGLRWKGGSGADDHRTMNAGFLANHTGLPKDVARAVVEVNRGASKDTVHVPKMLAGNNVDKLSVHKMYMLFKGKNFKDFDPAKIKIHT